MGAVPACAPADGTIVEVSLEAPAGAADKPQQVPPPFTLVHACITCQLASVAVALTTG